MDTGKVSRVFFEQRIATRLGADREDVAVGPKHGVDFGVVSVGEHALVTATDPISILPELGFERAGRFAVGIVLSDVAVSGLDPTHLTISFSLPPEMSDEQFGRVWDAIDAECRDLGVSIVSGHTARYEGCSFPWVGAATAMALGDPDDIVRPDGARPGDDLLVTKGPAVEVTGLFATLFGDRIDLPEDTLETARQRLDETGTVRDARAAAGAGRVTAMHDATEGGLLGALHEMADSAGVRLTVDSDSVPIRPGVEALSEAVSMDPWRASTAGTLLIAVDPADTASVLAALEARGTPVGHVGSITEGSGVVLDGEVTERPAGDSGWPVYERLLAE